MKIGRYVGRFGKCEGLNRDGEDEEGDSEGISKVGRGVAPLVAVRLHGLDDIQAGARTWWDGEFHSTLTQQGIASAAGWIGASPSTANAIGVAGDLAVGIGGFWKAGSIASLSRAGAADVERFIGPTIGRSGYQTMAEFRDAVFARYQRFYDMAYSRVQAKVASGAIPGDAMTVGARTDRIARAAMRQWLRSAEGIEEGSKRIIQVNRWLRDPTGSGAYRIPDVRIPGARLSLDGTIGLKDSATKQLIDIRAFSGDDIIVVRPNQIGGSYGIFFP